MPVSTRLDLRARIDSADPRKRTLGVLPKSPIPKRFCFRRVSNLKELRALLHIRYWGMGESQLLDIVHENSEEMDLDPYDLRSIHYGMFAVYEGQELPVGYARSVMLDRTEHADLVEQVADSSEELAAAADPSQFRPIPSVEYLPEPNRSVLEKTLISVLRGSESAVEGSRLCLIPEFRKLGLAIFLIECLVADAIFCEEIDFGYASMASSQQKIYQRLGFRKLEGTTDQYIPKLDVVGSCYSIRRQELSSAQRQRYAQLAFHLETQGRAESDNIRL